MRALAPALLAALLLTALPTPAAEVAGVKVPETFTVDGTSLVLNGAGLRTKTFLKVKVYVGALYLAQRSKDPAAIVAADAPKALRIVMLRDVDRASMVGSLRDGIESNSPGQAAALAPKVKELEAGFPAEFKEGQVLSLAYAPGKGLTIGIEGGVSQAFPGKDFADALFRIWLGPKPSDGGVEDLKEALLAGK